MGVLIEVPQYPEQANRFIVAPQNVYGGINSVKYTTLLGASQGSGRNWTGRMSLEIAQRIFDDFLDAANKGLVPEYFKSIRVTTYHGSDATQRKLILPREAEPEHVEPEVLPVAQAVDGAWRYVPTTGFSKGPREWTYGFAFMDSTNQPRTGTFTGKTKQECILRLLGSIMPAYVAEYVRTFPLARPEDIPREPEPEKEYVPTQAEIEAIPALTAAEWNAIPVSIATRRYALDWKFKVAVDKLSAKEDAERVKQEADKAAAREKDELEKRKKKYREEDADRARKGDL
jgi:hypothetical protein